MNEQEIEQLIRDLWKKQATQQPQPLESLEIKKVSKNIPKTTLKYLGLFIILFFVFYFGLNFQSYFLKAKYSYNVEIKGKPILLNNLPYIADTAKDSEINLPDSLIIDKIQVNAPILWQVEPQDVLKGLDDGIVHFKGTALPNDIDGNIALTGHSSSYPWQKTKYGQVFTLLDKLEVRDQITVIYKKKKYLYEVTNKKVVKPEQVEVLNSNEARLTLITCWPIGTTLKRLVVQARQIEKPSAPSQELFLPSVF